MLYFDNLQIFNESQVLLFFKVIKQFDRIEKKLKRKWGSFCRSNEEKSFWWRSPEIVVPEIQSDLGSKSQKIEMFEIEKKKWRMLWDASVAIQPVI